MAQSNYGKYQLVLPETINPVVDTSLSLGLELSVNPIVDLDRTLVVVGVTQGTTPFIRFSRVKPYVEMQNEARILNLVDKKMIKKAPKKIITSVQNDRIMIKRKSNGVLLLNWVVDYGSTDN
jgi:hypothetical protein